MSSGAGFRGFKSINGILEFPTESVQKYRYGITILGTAYHDPLGNTDKWKVRAYWSEMGTDDAIHER